MSNINPVRPGDLIKADFIDQLVSAISALEIRVQKLENGSVVGSGLTLLSASSPVTVGGLLTVTGANFSVPTGANTVTLGSTTITAFKALGDDKQFAFDVPPIPNLDPNGTSLPLTVTNASGGHDSRVVVIKPFVNVPHGAVSVVYDVAPVQQSPVTVGTPFNFGFTINAGVDIAADYAASLTIATGWSAVFLDDSGNPAGTQLAFHLDANPQGTNAAGQKKVVVQVKPTTTQATGALAVLAVTSTCVTTGAQVNTTPSQVTISYGLTPPSPDNRTQVSLVLPATTSGVVSVPRNSPVTLQFLVVTSVLGNYTAAFTLANATGWQVPPAAQSTVSFANTTSPGTVGSKQVSLPYTPGNGAVSTNLIVVVTHTDSGNVFTMTSAQPIVVT